MGVDPTPRAKFRRGELRLVLGLPEPWTEAQRDDFIEAIERLQEPNGVAVGDVRFQHMLLHTWNPSDQAPPPDVITPDKMEKLYAKFGITEPALRRAAVTLARDEAYQQGVTQGRIDCERFHDEVKAQYHKSGYDAGKLDCADTHQAIRDTAFTDFRTMVDQAYADGHRAGYTYGQQKAEGAVRDTAFHEGRAEGYDVGYALGRIAGIRQAVSELQKLDKWASEQDPENLGPKVHEPGEHVQAEEPAQAEEQKLIVETSARVFNLGPLTPEELERANGVNLHATDGIPDEACLQCGRKLRQCDEYGCDGSKPMGFRYGLKVWAGSGESASDAKGPVPDQIRILEQELIGARLEAKARNAETKSELDEAARHLREARQNRGEWMRLRNRIERAKEAGLQAAVEAEAAKYVACTDDDCILIHSVAGPRTRGHVFAPGELPNEELAHGGNTLRQLHSKEPSCDMVHYASDPCRLVQQVMLPSDDEDEPDYSRADEDARAGHTDEDACENPVCDIHGQENG